MFPFYKKDDPGGFLSNTSRCEPFTFIVPQFIMEMSEIPRDIKDVGDVKTDSARSALFGVWPRVPLERENHPYTSSRANP